MKDGLSGSDFLYLSLGGIAIYAAYKAFAPGGVFGSSIPTNNPTAPVSTQDNAIFADIEKMPFVKGVETVTRTNNPIDAALALNPMTSFLSGFYDSATSLLNTVSSSFKRSTPAPGSPNVSTASGPMFVDTSGVLPNYSSITGESIYVPPPKVTSSKASSSLSYTPATNYSSSTKVTGAKVGTIFKSGASVKSTGASGKYRSY